MVLEHLRWLPDDGAYSASRQGGAKYRKWGLDRWILKGVYDGINTNTVVTAKAAAGKKGKSIKAPKPFPTPDQLVSKIKKAKPVLSLAQLAARVNRQR
jgi:hypothetical protein